MAQIIPHDHHNPSFWSYHLTSFYFFIDLLFWFKILNSYISAKLGTDKNKKTICVYGHLDVQPAAIEDGWDSEPFTLEERDAKLYGRGASDDKGPAIGWLHVAKAYKELGLELPVNLWVNFFSEYYVKLGK